MVDLDKAKAEVAKLQTESQGVSAKVKAWFAGSTGKIPNKYIAIAVAVALFLLLVVR